jgi:hypothetical protein
MAEVISVIGQVAALQPVELFNRLCHRKDAMSK